MNVLHTLVVPSRLRRAEVVLVYGNLMDVGAVKPVDILVVSTFPGDYAPTMGSVEGALELRGIDLSNLARSKAVDLVDTNSSWLSRDIRGLGSGVNAKRILCLEEPDPRCLFRSLVALLADAKEPVTVAMPVIGTGDQGLDFDDMFQRTLEAASEWIRLGLPIARLEIVVSSTQRAARASTLFQAFATRQAAPPDRSGVQLRRKSYDYFLSYAHEDSDSADVFARALVKRARTVFVDRQELNPGAIWQPEIHARLDACKRIVPLLSPHYLASPLCIEEFNLALIRRRNERQDLVAPVYLASATLPTYFQLVQWIDCREADDGKLRKAAAILAGGTLEAASET